MRPVELKKGIYNVGAIDWNIRDFHGYSTQNGTTYNAFLIVDEKIALIDTVKKEFTDGLIESISTIIDPKKIDFIVSNHAEMDHSAAIPAILEVIGKEKPVYCSKMGAKNMAAHFSQPINYQVVNEKTPISLGSKTLTFIETRMLHWPDNMFTYIPEDKILFSSDAFGQHYSGSETFDDELGDEIFKHAKKYYANILLPYANHIKNLIKTLAEKGPEIDMIFPDHGLLWRKNHKSIIEKYQNWSEKKSEKKAVVLYDTMWHSTEKMAQAIVSGLNSVGINAIPVHVRKWHRSDIITELMDARAILVGSPTLNNGLFPTLAEVMTYIKGLRPGVTIGAAFGSYGWSGESVKLLNNELDALGVERPNDGLRIQYVPNDDQIKASFDFGVTIGEAALAAE